MKKQIKSTTKSLKSRLSRDHNIGIAQSMDCEMISPPNTQHLLVEQNPTCGIMKDTIQLQIQSNHGVQSNLSRRPVLESIDGPIICQQVPNRPESKQNLSGTSGYMQQSILNKRVAEEDLERTIEFRKRFKPDSLSLDPRLSTITRAAEIQPSIIKKQAAEEPLDDLVERKLSALEGKKKSDSTSAMSIDEDPLRICQCKYKKLNARYLMAKSHYHMISSIYDLPVDPTKLPPHYEISCNILRKAMTDVIEILEEAPHAPPCFFSIDQTSNTM